MSNFVDQAAEAGSQFDLDRETELLRQRGPGQLLSRVSSGALTAEQAQLVFETTHSVGRQLGLLLQDATALVISKLFTR